MTDILSDPSGNRRFIGVELTGPIDVSVRPNYQQLFAQALTALHNGEKSYFDAEQVKLIMKNNCQFEVAEPIDQYFMLYFDLVENEKEGEYLTAAMILSKETEIGANETAGELHDRLMHLGSVIVLETLQLIEAGKAITTLQQNNPDVKTAYKLNKENCKIDWSQSGKTIFNLIRGLSPYPAAWTYIKDGEQEWNVKIYLASFEQKAHSGTIGKITTTKKEIFITTKDGVLKIESLQFPGKKRMLAHELLNGVKLSENAIAL
jgi:hypothetical protein